MKLADPALLTLRQRFVVNMGVTNKNIIHECVNVLNPSRGLSGKKLLSQNQKFNTELFVLNKPDGYFRSWARKPGAVPARSAARWEARSLP